MQHYPVYLSAGRLFNDANKQSVPKRRHIKFRVRGIIQKKAYNIQNTAKV